MKIVIDDKDLIKEIVDQVIQQLKPILIGPSTPKDNVLMDVRGLLEYLNGQSKDCQIKESWVYDRVHRRTIPFEKAGNFLRFRKKYIDIWLLNPYHPDLSHYNLTNDGRG